MGTPQEQNIPLQALRVFAPQKDMAEAAPCYQAGRQLIELHLGTILHTEPIAGGLVSHVYKVTGEKQRGIVKIRGTHLAKLPHIAIDPKDLDYEWTALQILSDIEPTTFPQPLAIDRETSMLLMTDIIPRGKTLAARLEAKAVMPEEIRDIGATVARVHRKLAPNERTIREGGDQTTYRSDLARRIGYQENTWNPALNAMLAELEALPKQLILGDLAPKNIGQGTDRQPTICDLESLYRGDLLFAYGYLTGHILIHTLDNQPRSKAFVINLLDGYSTEDKTTDFDSFLLKKIALGAALYRLNNPVVPYELSLSPEERSKKAATALSLLRKDNMSWDELVQNMTET
jgi:hypothetical protein